MDEEDEEALIEQRRLQRLAIVQVIYINNRTDIAVTVLLSPFSQFMNCHKFSNHI